MRHAERTGVTAVENFPQFASGPTESVKLPKPEDFEGIYRRYSKFVFAICLRMTRDEAEAQDLMQEAFIQLLQKLGTFRGESAFTTWLYRLVVNVVLMELRRKRRRREESLEGLQDLQDQPRRPLLVISAPDKNLLGVIDNVSLQRALAQLPQGCRRVFVLHDIAGYEHHEIAEIFACSVGNTKSQLHKARLRLRKLLAHRPRRRNWAGLLRAGEDQAVRRSMPTCHLVAAWSKGESHPLRHR